MADPFEEGFGSPDDDGTETGFGSPDDTGPLGGETGFGSPANLTGASVAGGSFEAADDGGEVFELDGDFSAFPGPYTVTVVDGGDEFPCYGAEQGGGYWSIPTDGGTKLPFATPPLEPGTYDLRIDGEVSETIADALVVVRRSRYSGVYRFRSFFPPSVYPVGPHDVTAEPVLV